MTSDKIKLTKEIWNDFLDTAVDASGSAGWGWFEKKYGFTSESFEKLLLENQKKSNLFDSLLVENQTLLDTISQVKIANKMYNIENTKLSKALAEEMASNFKQAHLRAKLGGKLEKIAEYIYKAQLNEQLGDYRKDIKEILKEDKIL